MIFKSFNAVISIFERKNEWRWGRALKKGIVIGGSGAGKSTFARKIAELTGLPLYHLDMLWHKSDRTTVTEAEFSDKLSEILQQEKWLIDGNYLDSMERRLEECDTVFFLDYPVEVCLAGVESRIGQPREDMPWIETEFDPEFKQWIMDFEKDQRPGILQLLNQYKEGKEIFIFKARAEAAAYLEKVKPSS